MAQVADYSGPTWIHRDGRTYSFPEAPRVRPYRVTVFARGYRDAGIKVTRRAEYRGTHTRVELREYGYIGWTADQSAEPCRLEGSGTFMFAGALRAIAHVRREFQDPRVRQVQIRTNQDRVVFVYNRQADGRVTCYRDEEL